MKQKHNRYYVGHHPEINLTILHRPGRHIRLQDGIYEVVCGCGREYTISYSALKEKYYCGRKTCMACKINNRGKKGSGVQTEEIETTENRKMRFVDAHWIPTVRFSTDPHYGA